MGQILQPGAILGLDENGNLKRQYAILKCECGRRLSLHNHINTCLCGRDYDRAGMELVY